MTSDEIYAAIWECLEPFERGLQDAERKVALDSCVDAAAHKIAKRHDDLAGLLYECIVELSYVQESCAFGICASSKGEELIERGMDILRVKDLSAENLCDAARLEAGKEAKC